MVTGFKRNSDSVNDIQTVAITKVILEEKTASGMTRMRFEIQIDFSYPIGGLHVTPAVGEQWYVQRYQSVWRLKDKIPFNDPTILIPTTQGQVKVGSGTGPLELSGTQVNLYGPLNVHACPTTERPEDVVAGSHIFDTTLNKPVWYDGSGWRDASGSSV